MSYTYVLDKNNLKTIVDNIKENSYNLQDKQLTKRDVIQPFNFNNMIVGLYQFKYSPNIEIYNLRLIITYKDYTSCILPRIISLSLAGNKLSEINIDINLYLANLINKKIVTEDNKITIPLIFFDFIHKSKFPLYHLIYNSFDISVIFYKENKNNNIIKKLEIEYDYNEVNTKQINIEYSELQIFYSRFILKYFSLKTNKSTKITITISDLHLSTHLLFIFSNPGTDIDNIILYTKNNKIIYEITSGEIDVFRSSKYVIYGIQPSYKDDKFICNNEIKEIEITYSYVNETSLDLYTIDKNIFNFSNGLAGLKYAL